MHPQLSRGKAIFIATTFKMYSLSLIFIDRPGELQSKGSLTAFQLLKFFNTFDVSATVFAVPLLIDLNLPPALQQIVSLPATQNKLKEGVAKGFMPEDVMAEIESNIWIDLGIGKVGIV